VSTVRRAWPDILEKVKGRSRAAWMVLMEGVQVGALDGAVLTLAFDQEGKRKGFVNGGRDSVVREALKEYLGVDWRIETVTGAAPAGPPQTGDQAGPPPAAGPVSGTSVPASRGQGAAAADDVPPPPPPPISAEPPPYDERDEVDPEGDANAEGDGEHSGMALIQRELGGQVIQEIDNSSS
jgi:DNA polymerase-3 subunit gamma/tau